MGDRGIRTPAQLDALNSGIRLSRSACQGRTPDTDVYYLMRLGHESGPLMGFVTLVQRAASTPPDLGWCILEQFMGQGYAAEAGKEVLRMAREDLGIDEIIAWPGIENPRSIRVAQKIGFVEGGTIIKTDGTGSTLVYILPGMKFDSSMRLSFRGEQKPQAYAYARLKVATIHPKHARRSLHWTWNEMAPPRTLYTEWPKEDLIARIGALEKELRNQTETYKASVAALKPHNTTTPPLRPRKPRANREFDPSRYSTRLIALKFAYLGQNYNGLEYHPNNKTPLPTVEEALWNALNKARLIFPTHDPSKQDGEINWEGCEYSKCGRTDRGVSAFGQVIGIKVRSNRPLRTDVLEQGGVAHASDTKNDHDQSTVDAQTTIPAVEASAEDIPTPSSSVELSSGKTHSFDSINDEIPYPQVLNRLLPPDIRVLAWCPSPPKDFSARFSCKERRYKYFFTQPAFTPSIGEQGFTFPSAAINSSDRQRREGWLDLQAMRDAAKKFEGLHDFRNFCKVDPSKQIENFERRIFYSGVEELDHQKSPVGYVGSQGFQEYRDGGTRIASGDTPAVTTYVPRIFVFTLHGSAFLWHQVRHMVAILFLIGQGLEAPSLIDELLDVSENPRKPQYEMADDAPLVLWDCIFPSNDGDPGTDALEWVYVGDYTGYETGIVRAGSAKGGDGKYGLGGLISDMWQVWRRHKMDEVLAGTLIDVMVGQGQKHWRQAPRPSFRGSQKVFAGGDGTRLVGKYTAVMEKPRMETVEVINARYIAKKNDGSDHEGRKPR
ncbi:MAG: hypothetical protein Q9191_001395 [Dirinaria sp. TL-2023a]